jgi:Ca2+/H+ antiporter, TMEM165/GDT1 family
MTSFAIAWPAIAAAFLASLVEVVEAFTIILAVGVFQGWKPALLGTLAGLVLLAVIVTALGPLLGLIPIHALQFVVGVLLLLFGMRWLRKAVLRSAGIIALRDETATFAKEKSNLEHEAARVGNHFDWIAALTVFKAVLLEGLEVVFIVIAVGAGRDLLWPASLGALAACVIVLLVGLILHKPLSRVPENSLKFGVGVMLAAFGVYWTGEGLGIAWPGEDLAIVTFAALFLVAGLATAAALRRPIREAVR